MSEDAQATFGQRIRHYREARGISQQELASSVGRGHAMISMLERGQRQIHVDEIVTFARVLNVPAIALLGDEAGDLYSEGYRDGYDAALKRARELLDLVGSLPEYDYAKELSEINKENA